MSAIEREMTDEIMGVVDTNEATLPWWATAKPEDLFINREQLSDSNDALYALLMGLKVPSGAPGKEDEDGIFVVREAGSLKSTRLMTSVGYKEYKESRVGLQGWSMMKQFCRFAQGKQRWPETSRSEMCVLVSNKAVWELTELFFSEVVVLRKRGGGNAARLQYKKHRRWKTAKGMKEFETLVTPLLHGAFTGDSRDTDDIGDMLQKLKYGIFEKTGIICNYSYRDRSTKYQNEKKKGDSVVCVQLDNAWALCIAAALRVRLTIWDNTFGTGDVRVLNNDDIIELFWSGHTTRTNQPCTVSLDHVLMCRTAGGRLRAIRKYNSKWPGSHWSKLPPSMIPTLVYQQMGCDPILKSPAMQDGSGTEQPWHCEVSEFGSKVEVRLKVAKARAFCENLQTEVPIWFDCSVFFCTNSHVTITLELEDLMDNEQHLLDSIRGFAKAVSDDTFWKDKHIPTGYQIIPQLNRVHVIWFMPIKRIHTPSFLRADLTVTPEGSIKFLVTHVTADWRVLCRDQEYRSEQLENAAEFVAVLSDLHRSDYELMKKESPRDPTVAIKVLKWFVSHPGISQNMMDAKFFGRVSDHKDQIRRVMEKFCTEIAHCKCNPTKEVLAYGNEGDVYTYTTKTLKHMRVRIHVQEDGQHAVFTLEQTGFA